MSGRSGTRFADLFTPEKPCAYLGAETVPAQRQRTADFGEGDMAMRNHVQGRAHARPKSLRLAAGVVTTVALGTLFGVSHAPAQDEEARKASKEAVQ
jgi:hypothetical protein